ncbi:hypothetical protein [Janibacter sp. LM]|uniref:hypothetical protein n=1 Tax=Janibacter sp. LM TaxID=3144845 RepID=UPI0031F6FE86
MAGEIIVPWRVTGVEDGPVWDAINGVDYLGPMLPPATFVPVRASSILRDGDPSTYVQFTDVAGSGPDGVVCGQLEPTRTPPKGDPLWLRLTVQGEVVGPAPGHWTLRLTSFVNGRPEFGNRWAALEPEASASHPVGGFTDVGRVYHLDSAPSEGFTWWNVSQELDHRDLTFLRGDRTRPVWLSFLLPYSDGGSSTVRLSDVLVEVAYPGDRPLRQRQRDDHLAPGGAIRARGANSRQGSIRAKAYE